MNCFFHLFDFFFLVFFKGFVDLFHFFICLFLHFFEGIFNFLFKGLKHSPQVIFRSLPSASSIFRCSSITKPQFFVGVVLLYICGVECVLILSTHLFLDVVGAVSLVISLPGASGSRAQMVAHCGTVWATV